MAVAALSIVLFSLGSSSLKVIPLMSPLFSSYAIISAYVMPKSSVMPMMEKTIVAAVPAINCISNPSPPDMLLILSMSIIPCM